MAIEAKKLNTLIKSISTRSATMRADIQAALIGCAYHAQVHRNVAAFDQLITAVGNGTRLEGMTNWIKKYAPVHFTDGKAILSSDRQKAYEGGADEYEAELADAANWYDLQEKNNIQKSWDSVGELDNVIALLDSRAKKADKNDSVVAGVMRQLAIAARVQKTKLLDQYDVAVAA